MSPLTAYPRLNLASEDLSHPPAEDIEDRIGRYKLIRRLASGGMAEAFVAVSGDLPGLRSLVVVKRILPRLSSNENFVRMFLDEARIGVMLEHPNIVRIIEVGHDRSGYYLAMEPVQGKPLSAVLRRAASRRSPLGQAQAAFIIGQAADGLGYAHGLSDGQGRPLNIVHRDVSPQNILVSFEGAVKVIDFGIASATGRQTETVPGGLKGKIEYMSPEQISGDVVDRRSDVFALGVVLWEALTGRRLFHRETELATMRAIMDEPIPRPSSETIAISPRLERIVMRALEKAPADRFQDAREMGLLLQRHAFASDGFSPTALATQMKRLFSANHTRWAANASAAQELEAGQSGNLDEKASGVFAADSPTRVPTLKLLRSLPDPEAEGPTTIDDAPERAQPDPPTGLLVAQRRPRRVLLWGVGSLGLLALVVVASLTWPPSRGTAVSSRDANQAERSIALRPDEVLLPTELRAAPSTSVAAAHPGALSSAQEPRASSGAARAPEATRAPAAAAHALPPTSSAKHGATRPKQRRLVLGVRKKAKARPPTAARATSVPKAPLNAKPSGPRGWQTPFK